MAANSLIAGQVMAKSASLLNDTARTVYTYAAQLPYLQMALQELREMFELNNIGTSQQTSAVIPIDAGVISVGYNGVFPTPTLPNDMVEPAQLWERPRGIDPFIPMTKRDYLPHYLEGVQNSNFIFYVWEDQKLKFLPCVADNDIKIDYIRELFQSIVDENSPINVANSETFLEYRTAALCAEFIERNETSSNSLNAYAVLGIDRAIGIGVKGKQMIATRRRPFRAGYKRRGFMT
jgi:hypothetical protein